MVMNNTNTPDASLLRVSAALLLVGQLLYVVITLLHTGGEANHHPAIFAAYAGSGIWTAVHAAQFACMAMFLSGLFALFSALNVQAGTATLASQFGAAATTATLALYGAVLAVDGVALKQAVTAWMAAPDAEKAARFAAAETMRWLEWGARSYANFTLGLAVLLAAAVTRSTRIPRPIASLIALSGLAYLMQGWLAGAQGFSPAHTFAIIAAEIVNVAWMTWLLMFAGRMRRFESLSPSSMKAAWNNQ
jgi:hypothetical protein